MLSSESLLLSKVQVESVGLCELCKVSIGTREIINRAKDLKYHFCEKLRLNKGETAHHARALSKTWFELVLVHGD